MKITVNGHTRDLDVDPAMPLLWVLRDEFGLIGTRYGCGRGLCGACTVHVDGKAIRSCVFAVRAVAAQEVTTIEGLKGLVTDGNDNSLHPVQAAWIEADVPQCGFCQSGQIMQAAALLAANPEPTREEVDAAMRGNLCRCGTYARVRRAIAIAAATLGENE